MLINNTLPEQFFANPNHTNPDSQPYIHFKNLSLTDESLLKTFIRAIQKVPPVELEQHLVNIIKQK